jgi:DHA2 family multidrug resistance protein
VLDEGKNHDWFASGQIIALPLFFIPTTGIVLGSVEARERDSATGLMNFLRTLSGAFATSVVDYLIISQGGMRSTNQVMTGIAVMFFIAAAIIWLAPIPTRSIEPGAGGH